MKTFKKALSILLGIAIMLSCVAGMQVGAVNINTQCPNHKLTLTVDNKTVDPDSVNVGDIVEVDITISNVVGGYNSLAFGVKYDPEILQPAEDEPIILGSVFEETLGDAFVFSRSKDLTGGNFDLIWAFYSAEHVTCEGVIATLKFEIIGNVQNGESTNIALGRTFKGSLPMCESDKVVTIKAENEGKGSIKFTQCDHVNTTRTTVVKPTTEAKGLDVVSCNSCGHCVEKIATPRKLKLRQRNLTLANNISVNYYAEASDFGNDGYTNPYVVFVRNEIETVVNEYEVTKNGYCFSYNVVPQALNDTMTVYLRATYDGEEYSSDPLKCLVTEYCYTQLRKSDAGNNLKRLMVDILNYAAAAQNYTGHNIDNLSTSLLDKTEVAFGTSDDGVTKDSYSDVKDTNFEVIDDDPPAAFKSVGLSLNSSVEVKFHAVFSADIDVSKVKLVAYNEANTKWEQSSDTFKYYDSGEYKGRHEFYFDGLAAHQLDDVVYYQFYVEDTPISNKLRYSAESFVQRNFDKLATSDPDLQFVLIQMMDYSRAAQTYSDNSNA